MTSGASRPRRRIFPSGHANEGPRRGPGGEGAGQAGDVQLQPGFKRFSEQVSGGGEGLIAWLLTPPGQGSLSPLGFPERGAQVG